MRFTETARHGYASLFAKMRIRPGRLAAAKRIAIEIASNRSRYQPVSAATNVPWWWIGIVHHMESGINFATHLHNGDSLTARTRHVPAGRPSTGSPPFSWQESAVDALRLKNLHREKDWSFPKALYNLEKYNGFGYVSKGVNSPYLWSFSNLYSRGKYVADGRYSASAVSQQCGAAVILRCLQDGGFISMENNNMTEIDDSLLEIIGLAAPTVAMALGSPAAGIAVRVLADVFETDSTADAVMSQLKTSSLPDVQTALGRAEAEFMHFVEALTPKVSAQKASAEEDRPIASSESGIIDLLIGGSSLTGYKTLIGVAGYVALSIIGILGVWPEIFTPALISAFTTFFAGFAGVGLIAKIDRFLNLLKK